MTPGVLEELGQVRKHFVALTGLAAATIFAGSLVAEIDGGREFQTFPKMGDRWIPHGLFDQKVGDVCACRLGGLVMHVMSVLLLYKCEYVAMAAQFPR